MRCDHLLPIQPIPHLYTHGSHGSVRPSFGRTSHPCQGYRQAPGEPRTNPTDGAMDALEGRAVLHALRGLACPERNRAQQSGKCRTIFALQLRTRARMMSKRRCCSSDLAAKLESARGGVRFVPARARWAWQVKAHSRWIWMWPLRSACAETNMQRSALYDCC